MYIFTKNTIAFFRCNHCGWFLCSSRCEESKKHRPECSLIQKAGKVKKLKKDDLAKLEAFHELIPVMRGLYLKGTKIEKYQFILGLDAHGEHRRKSGRCVNA